jgi:transcriptional regulator GlxA family with amidase domain
MLQQRDAVTTVEDVALSCGFADVRRFALDYGSAFGEHPSQTLGRGG